MSDGDIIKRLTSEVFEGGNLDAFDELIADDYVTHDPPPGFSPDKEGFRQAATAVISAFSDRKAERDEITEMSDGRFVEDWLFTGKHTSEIFGLPPSNQQVQIRGTEIHRVKDGKVVENWGTVDLSDVIEKAMGS